MRNKTISLCDESYKIAQNIPNFSEWVRYRILLTSNTDQQTMVHASAYIKPKPQKNYLCRICRMAGHWTDECKYELGA